MPEGFGRVYGIFVMGGGQEYLTEEINPPIGEKPRIGKQFYDKEGKFNDRGIIKYRTT